MKNLILLLILAVFVNTSFSQKNAAQQSINSLSAKLFNQIYSKSENCFFSPYSIFGALSMTYAGAKENTRSEIETMLEIRDGDSIHHIFKELNSEIELNKEIQFLSSNSLWLQKNFKLQKEYSKLIEQNYQAKSKNADFTSENNREKARKDINGWVDKQTKGNIADFIKPGILDESTIMVIINAIYFKAFWNVEFLPKDTKDKKFLAASGDSVNCRMMNSELKANYYEDELAQVIEIPYENNKASMTVILPKDSVNPEVKQFNFKYLSKLNQFYNLRDIKLSLPIFKLEVDYDLSEPLKKLGMKSSFEPGANFSGITGQKDLFISSILHKSIIEVSEKGTEASSVTAVISTRSTAVFSKGPVVFNADRPFIFFIKDNTTGTILFMGYLAQPK